MAGNSGNMTGAARVRVETPAEEMEAFDQLPPSLRQVLANAKFEWPSGEFLRRLRQGYSVQFFTSMIEDYERVH